jgi:protein-S-isoprenylcysteine O-methyltransferase Ste14
MFRISTTSVSENLCLGKILNDFLINQFLTLIATISMQLSFSSFLFLFQYFFLSLQNPPFMDAAIISFAFISHSFFDSIFLLVTIIIFYTKITKRNHKNASSDSHKRSVIDSIINICVCLFVFILWVIKRTRQSVSTTKLIQHLMREIK